MSTSNEQRIETVRRGHGTTAMAILSLLVAVVGAASPTSARAVVIEQLALPATAGPPTFMFSWRGGGVLSGARAPGATGGILYEAISLNPLEITPETASNSEALAATTAPTGNTWLLSLAPSVASYIPPSEATFVPQLFEMTATGAVLRYKLPPLKLGEEPTSFAFGADGTIWLARPEGVEHYVPGGSSKLYSVGGWPYQIIAGPGGDLYFTQPLGNEIGRIDLAGEVSEIPLQGASSTYEREAEPWALVVGAEGNVYFTEEGLGRIGRIGPGGTLSEFAIPPPADLPAGIGFQSRPKFIAVGEEGDIWFTDPGTDSVGRLTQSGEVTELLIPQLPTSQGGSRGFEPAGPQWITSIPGRLLFSENNLNAIGIVKPNAEAAEHMVASTPLQGKLATASRRRCHRASTRRRRASTRNRVTTLPSAIAQSAPMSLTPSCSFNARSKRPALEIQAHSSCGGYRRSPGFRCT